jgi:hypothetical protein
VFNLSRSGSLQIGNLMTKTWLFTCMVMETSCIVLFYCTIIDEARGFSSMVSM